MSERLDEEKSKSPTKKEKDVDASVDEPIIVEDLISIEDREGANDYKIPVVANKEKKEMKDDRGDVSSKMSRGEQDGSNSTPNGQDSRNKRKKKKKGRKSKRSRNKKKERRRSQQD